MYLGLGHEPEMNEIKVGTLPENNELVKQAWCSPQKGDSPPSLSSPAPCHPLLTYSDSFTPLRPPATMASISARFPAATLERPSVLATLQPRARAAFRVPAAPLFSFPCNSRGQVRCASKHCNHILNGNEMCELNVNYSRMEDNHY